MRKSVIGLLALAGVAVAGAGPGQESPKAGAPSLEALKKLAGDWVDAKEGGKVITSYAVTAGGSAVREILFPGAEHEMVTMYHLDGEDLVLTHYCAEGNQPRMRARAGASGKQLVFTCAGGTNIKSENDAHMHQATITWIDEDHIHSEWVGHADGRPAHTASFELVRKKG